MTMLKMSEATCRKSFSHHSALRKMLRSRNPKAEAVASIEIGQHLTTRYRRYWAKRRKFHELNQYIKIHPSLFLTLSFNSKKLNSDTSRLRCLLQTFSCFVLWLQVDSQWAKLTKKSVKIHVERQQFLWECCPLFLWSSPQSPAFVHLSPLPSSLLDTLWSLFGYICLYTLYWNDIQICHSLREHHPNLLAHHDYAFSRCVPQTNMAVTVLSWAKSKAKPKFVTIKLQSNAYFQHVSHRNTSDESESFMHREQHELAESCTTKHFQTSAALSWKNTFPMLYVGQLHMVPWIEWQSPDGKQERGYVGSSCEIQDLLCRSPMLLQWLNTAIHLHSSLWHSSTWVFLSSLHLQHTFTIGDGSVHFPYLTTSRFGTGWASIGFLSSKRWADLEVDPNSFSSCPRPNHAGLPGLPWGDTSVRQRSLWLLHCLSSCHECESWAPTSLFCLYAMLPNSDTFNRFNIIE